MTNETNSAAPHPYVMKRVRDLLDPWGYSRAAVDVLTERDRQITKEGWTHEKDDAHDAGEMARAAACYALIGGSRDRSLWRGDIPNFWPWGSAWWKPTTRRRDLVKAAALILAEIERLDRREARNGQ